MRKILAAGIIVMGFVAGLGTSFTRLAAQQRSAATGGEAAVTVDVDDIGGVVRSAKGPEAGVWVIAETKSLPTGFRKIVVTDDRGRYVVPDLPNGTYSLWVRGYGLIDSKAVQTAPGKMVNLTAVVAPSPRAAAQYYPANYWYSLIQIPPKSAFPMQFAKGTIETQLDWVSRMKAAIQLIQIGDKATREFPEKLGKFKTSAQAFEAWLESGESPVNVGNMNRDLAVKMYADWIDRIQTGELPSAPPRPQGVERNIVISQWDWSDDKAFIHDVITTDTRNPTLNPNGFVYGPEQFSSDTIVALDPVKNSWTRFPVPMRDHDMPKNYNRPPSKGPAPLTWGDQDVRPATMRLHNMMMDQKGRFWITAKFRKMDSQPDFCKQGSSHPSAKFFPLDKMFSELALETEIYDPKTQQFTMVDTCFGTHHLQFGADANNTLWFSGLGTDALGYINTNTYDETHDAAKSQGWCPFILDTNGNGKPDPGWAEPDQPVVPGKDKRIRMNSYGIAPSPVDGSVWLGTDQYPGKIVRVHPGANPPYTCLAEVYNSPRGLSNPKGIFVERDTGLLWIAFAGSGHFATFDRRKCKVTSGPTATGDHCPEGWTVYPVPGPKFKGAPEIGADWYYLNWVDRFDTLGLGPNVPMAPGTNSDSVIAFLPKENKFVEIRVPYPLGFYSRGMDGRIDDPKAGWKGKGLWTNYASISPWNYEGGKGATGKAVKFQVRPDPLAH
ncbi:MAG TPA: carboxypeptidase-like regulatory domain-containing protein [Candidatus Solibacter sp.]|nr:carboxypeptidase-like regulatory domain-containing protein [Candidatus Solibacter sp.]